MVVDVFGLKNKLMFKNLFKKPTIINHQEQLNEWEKSGRTSPPPHIVKQMAIDEYQKKFNTKILVETGTYLGDMVEAQRDRFEKIYSVELSKKLFQRAVKRFKSYSHINILNGDSGIVLNKILPEISSPALFWLDGHYSEGITAKGVKECPVVEELQAILKSDLYHIILIDDARLFNGTHDYPTLNEIRELIKKSNRHYSLTVKDDIIRLIPDIKNP
jgi:hypothetical protein